jgi:ATP-dependent 26S proteasome regulatory subunit
MLDQMDGLRPHEDIGFVLTTNSIERMEAAIKDRPGRISQCIHFGSPHPELRKRYLMHYLRRYATKELDIEGLVRDSKGATQAFLKEWVHRSVQIALERMTHESMTLQLTKNDFHLAMREMKRFSEGETGKIIGFQS